MAAFPDASARGASSYSLKRPIPAELTRSAADPNLLSLLSYNVLAQCFVGTERVGTLPAYLTKAHRHALIHERIAHANADVVCLQEVEIASFRADWADPLSDTYVGILQDDVGRTSKQVTANATFFRMGAFDVVTEQHRSRSLILGLRRKFGQLAADSNADLHPSVVAAAAAAAKVVASGATEKEIKRARAALSKALVAVPAEDIIWVANCHLQADPTLIDLRLAQVSAALNKGVANALDAAGLAASRAVYFLCGDFNDRPGSLVYDFVATGKTVAGATARVGAETVTIERAYRHGLQLASAYVAACGLEPEFTFLSPAYPASTIDFIWFSVGDRLQVVAVADSDIADELPVLQAKGIPNDNHGSDHLPIAAVFRINP